MQINTETTYTDPTDLPTITQGQEVVHPQHGTVTVNSVTTSKMASAKSSTDVEVPVKVTATTSTGKQVTFPAIEVTR